MKNLLSNWLNQDLNTFFSSYWNEKECLFQSSTESKVPFSLSKLEHILNYYPLSYEQLKVFDNGGVVPVQAFTKSEPNFLSMTIDKEKLFHPEFLKNKTIVIKEIHKFDEQLLHFQQQLEQAFQCPVNLNLYYSNGNINGANAHYDHHHIFAAQIYGKKIWQLGDIVIENPTADYHPYVGEHSFNQTITTVAGDILYIPPGQWHAVETENESLHLAIGIHPPTWEKVIFESLKQVSEEHSIFRTGLPFTINEDTLHYQKELKNELSILFKLLIEEKVKFSKTQHPKVQLDLQKK